MRPNDVAQALDLDRIAKDHVWKVEPSCATSGEGKERNHKKRKLAHTNKPFQQASSKVSHGSARTSRWRRSKADIYHFPHFTHPTIRRTNTTTKSRSSSEHRTNCAGVQFLAVFPELTTSNNPPTLHDRLHVLTGYPRISRRRNQRHEAWKKRAPTERWGGKR